MPISKHQQQRESIQERCETLKKLLGSLERNIIIDSFLQDLTRTHEAAKNGPDDKIDELDEQLATLMRELKTTVEAGAIIPSRARQEKLYGGAKARPPEEQID